MKIGIMGGTFDPIHIGHLLLGEFAYEQFHLDEIWFLPNGNPPHKDNDNGINLDERIAMVNLAIEDVPYFRISLHEAKEESHSYTYQTMSRFREKYPDNDFYFILGADSLFALERWKNFKEIFPTCTILAAMRDDKDVSDMEQQIHYLKEKYQAQIEILKSPVIDISSTIIRNRVANKMSVRYMVPDAVADYIFKKGLYTDGNSKDTGEA